ncbi:MAG TPA: hypothetical protein VGC30_01380 [Dokdonella sp.]
MRAALAAALPSVPSAGAVRAARATAGCAGALHPITDGARAPMQENPHASPQ